MANKLPVQRYLVIADDGVTFDDTFHAKGDVIQLDRDIGQKFAHKLKQLGANEHLNIANNKEDDSEEENE